MQRFVERCATGGSRLRVTIRTSYGFEPPGLGRCPDKAGHGAANRGSLWRIGTRTGPDQGMDSDPGKARCTCYADSISVRQFERYWAFLRNRCRTEETTVRLSADNFCESETIFASRRTTERGDRPVPASLPRERGLSTLSRKWSTRCSTRSDRPRRNLEEGTEPPTSQGRTTFQLHLCTRCHAITQVAVPENHHDGHSRCDRDTRFPRSSTTTSSSASVGVPVLTV